MALMTRSNRRSSLLFLCLVIFGLAIYHVIPLGFQRSYPRGMALIEPELDWKWKRPLDPDQVCQLTSADPFDPSVLPHLEAARPIVCKWREPPLTILSATGILHFNQTALREAGYKPANLRCHYRLIERPEGQDDTTHFSAPEPLVEEAQVRAEFVSVQCRNWLGMTVYTNIHATPRHLKPPPISRSSDQQLSIAVFGVDSLSRLNALRHLPATFHYLTRQMGAVVLQGLMKNGDNTYPNMAAVLTGRKVYSDELKYLVRGEYYDDYWNLVWSNFSRAGYVTLLAEDLPEFTLFNHLTSGFYKQPTDHYFRPFWVAVEKSSQHAMSSNLCFGRVPKHLLHVNYVQRFLEHYRDVPYFAFSFLTEISHDYLNQVGAADLDLKHFLRHVHEGGHLNHTVLVFMGDHGHRFDPIRTTPIGRLEESMPFVALYMPPWVRKQHPQAMDALQTNIFRLTSMFDLFNTIVDILNHATKAKTLGEDPLSMLIRGQSLFTEISKNRTCQSAGIPQQYCMCDPEEPLPLDDPLVQPAAMGLVAQVNEITTTFRNICALLTLHNVHNAQLIRPNRHYREVRLRVTVETMPGKALFEGILAMDSSGKMRSLYEISRINRYHGQDWCLKDNMDIKRIDLRKYCYCA